VKKMLDESGIVNQSEAVCKAEVWFILGRNDRNGIQRALYQ